MDSQLSKTVSTALIRPLEVSKSYFKCNPQNGPGGALFSGMSPHEEEGSEEEICGPKAEKEARNLKFESSPVGCYVR